MTKGRRRGLRRGFPYALTRNMGDTHFGFGPSTRKKARRVRGVFDSVASRYDVMNDLMSLGLHPRLEDYPPWPWPRSARATGARHRGRHGATWHAPLPARWATLAWSW